MENNTNMYTTEGVPINDGVGPAPTSSGVSVVTTGSTSIPPPTAYHQPTAQVANQRYVNVGSRHPVMLTYCPSCAKTHTATHVHTKVTGTTWVCVIAGVFIFWPLCWVPLVVKGCKQTNHYCDGCGAKVGRVKPFQ